MFGSSVPFPVGRNFEDVSIDVVYGKVDEVRGKTSVIGVLMETENVIRKGDSKSQYLREQLG